MEPPAAKWAPSRSPSRVTATRSGWSATRRRAADRSSTTATLRSSRTSAGRTSSGADDHVDGVDRAVRQARPVAVVERGAAAEQQPGAPEVVVLEVADRLDGSVRSRHHDRVGGGAEGGRDRGLVAVVDVEQRGHGPEQAADRVGRGEQRAGAVLAVEAELERVAPRDQPGAVAVGLLGLLAGRGQLLLDLVEGGHGLLVLGVEALLAGVEAGDLGLEGGEVALRALRAGGGVLAGVGEPLDLRVGGLGTGLERVDLAGEPGQSLAAVGGGALEAGDPPLLLGGRLLGAPLGHDGGVERSAAAARPARRSRPPGGVRARPAPRGRRGRDRSRPCRPRRLPRRCGSARRRGTRCRAAAP